LSCMPIPIIIIGKMARAKRMQIESKIGLGI